MPSSLFYNTIAPFYNNYCNSSGINYYEDCEVALVASYSPTSILEFGIGTGRFARNYIQKHAVEEYVGVDNAKTMLDHASDIPVTLIHNDFDTYIDICIATKKTFDIIVAPYTAMHHIQTEKQEQLLEKMLLVSPVVILNCLNEIQEEYIFGESTSTLITFPTPNNIVANTTIYKIAKNVLERSTKLRAGEHWINVICGKIDNIIKIC